jgi:tetratricopeptide (TPR) repeat protein
MWKRQPLGESLASARQFSLRGAEALQQENWGDAEGYFSEALRQSGMDERAHWGYAEAMWVKGDRAAATRHMEEAVRLSGSNPDLSVRLGQMQLEQGKLDEASRHAKIALENNRRHPGAWALEGDVLVAWQRWDEALAAYHRALVYQPDFPAVQIAVAELYQRMERPQRALATLDRLADQHSLDRMPVRATWLRGEALVSLGRTQEASQMLDEAERRLGQSDVEMMLAIAKTRFRIGDAQKSMDLLAKVDRISPDDRNAALLREQIQFANSQVTPAGLARQVEPQDKIR